jgi:tyrosine-protein kinase Etk/Wzc
LPPVKAESSPTQYYEAIFDVLAKQLELAKLDEAREGAFIQVVDPAVVPEQKSFPKRGMLTITGIAGGITFGIMLALLQGGWRGCSIIPQPRTNWTF